MTLRARFFPPYLDQWLDANSAALFFMATVMKSTILCRFGVHCKSARGALGERDGFEVMQACFPPALSPMMLAHVMDQSRPTFSTASTARFYKEPGITSVFDKLMVSLVRIAFREMLHRLATADAKNPMVPNWEMRYTARSSMYWFLKGSECINDISWPEYARRLLMALDLEREVLT